ncbi:hypothetical protein Q2T41_13850 [Maribacter confluentis]|uniref:DUF3575 domain-containing protein n=1 Tax=Maribacter confluentis TaxID=1656093 RepID=A0ABT8RS44_9FLAO|nr:MULTISPECIES: hypothetical protein [Maribacter]MDO1513742.1 hypothetical protein [Maribacter confluentis]TVZ16986.1 hypothetical protein JM81_3260 [Maribacter sp. MAR_2009_72]
MKQLFFLPVLLLSIFYANAQTNRLVEEGIFKVNALLPGASYEVGVGNKSTINMEAIIGFALRGATNTETQFGIYPGFAADFRNYINFERRLRKRKNISGNSGNYISFLNQFQFGTPLIGNLEYASDYYYNAALVYGLQRTYKKGFYFSLAFGPGIFINEFDKVTGILVDARLGWVIGGRK